MAPPPFEAVVREFEATAPAGNDLLTQSHGYQHHPAYNLRRSNFNQSRASLSNSRHPFDQTAKSRGAIIPFVSSPAMPRRFPAALSNKRMMEHTSRRVSAASDSAHLKVHTRTKSNISNAQRREDTVEGTREVTIRKDTIFRALLGGGDGSPESAQRALGVDYQAVVHVNRKEIPCPGKFGDLCESFLREIQTYQSAMAEFDNTEDALACSTIFEARPYRIYLGSYLLPIMLHVDAKARNKVLDEHDAFLEEWVRSIKDIRNATSLSDMSNEHGRRRDQRLMDLDELLKEEAAKANQKRKSQVDEDEEKLTGRMEKRPCLSIETIAISELDH
ncbi:hypothetical protein DSL72_004034 [Monilinia vaccinii-corymbosi]|uniref:Uncharacterized protein n=1 Tax=Monilinia vaccinii-corymbosi TaxID=61207 RepID=A0A8A3NZG6_9HELO|nr:hypothetical protein DSL72_004034 [Monilinia vaccinii-corymbosi]